MLSSSLSVSVSLLVRCMEPATACFLTSSPHTSPFPLPDPIPQLAIRPPASFNEFSNDKLITVVYSHLLCLSTSWFWGGPLALCRSSVHLLLPTGVDSCQGGFHMTATRRPSGRLDRATNILCGKTQVLLWPLTYPTLLSNRGGRSESNRK